MCPQNCCTPHPNLMIQLTLKQRRFIYVSTVNEAVIKWCLCTLKAFESHIKRDHPDYRPYPCTECDKRFFAKVIS